MTKFVRLSAYAGMVAAMLLALAGCDHSKQKVAHVQMMSVSHVVVFESGKKHLSKAELDSLDGFIRSIPVSAVTYVGLEADDTLKKAVMHARQIKAYLVKRNVDRELIHLQPIASGDDNTIILNIEYAVGVPPHPCPDWSKDGAGTYNTTVGSNFGCAYYTDMIVQMANPADFEAAEGHTPVIDAERDSALIQKYRSNSGSAGSSVSTSSTTSSSGSGSSTSTAR